MFDPVSPTTSNLRPTFITMTCCLGARTDLLKTWTTRPDCIPPTEGNMRRASHLSRNITATTAPNARKTREKSDRLVVFCTVALFTALPFGVGVGRAMVVRSIAEAVTGTVVAPGPVVRPLSFGTFAVVTVEFALVTAAFAPFTVVFAPVPVEFALVPAVFALVPVGTLLGADLGGVCATTTVARHAPSSTPKRVGEILRPDCRAAPIINTRPIFTDPLPSRPK